MNMAKTLGDITQELSEKILAPAKTEASEILAGARKQAEAILAEAQGAADKIRISAAKEAEDLRKQLDVDLDTAARNFIIMVQEKLEAAVVNPVVEGALKPRLSDPEFLKQMIEILLVEFPKCQGREQVLEVLLPEKNRAELETWFLEKFREKAVTPLVVRFSDKISFGFHIGVEGEGAYFNFSSGLVEAFTTFCSPRFRKHFFPQQRS